MLVETVVAATALNGLLAGASLDQSIKQLPSRHRIGVKAYAVYVRGADLGTGVWWYAALANGAVLATLVAAYLAWRGRLAPEVVGALGLAALFSVAHTVATLRAAPTMFKSRGVALDDERTLAVLFDRFARWQTARAVCQVIAFALCLWSSTRALDLS